MLFNKRIAEALEQSDLTQKEIAKRLNISEGNITNWKKGENLPSVEMLYKICLLLNESADYLLGLEDIDGHKESTDYEFRYEDKFQKFTHKEKTKEK